jgi:hypothetical protein
LYDIKGDVKVVNEARFAKLHQMTGKMNRITGILEVGVKSIVLRGLFGESI